MISHLALARNDQPQPAELLVQTRVVALQAEGGAPKRIHILPRGPEIVGRDGRSWRMSHPQAVVDAFAANGMPLPIDYEHASEKDADGDARPAAGWVERLELKADGIWGDVSWTPKGGEMVANREYRFLSPAFLFDPQTREIAALSSAGLVHRPNLHLTALNRRDNPEPPMWKAVLIALGLAETATETDAVTAINALKSEKTVALNAAENPPLDRFVPRSQHDATVTALNSVNARLAEIDNAEKKRKAEDLVTDAVQAGKVAPAAKEQFVTMALNSFDATKAAIDAMPVVLKPGEDPALRDRTRQADPGGLTGNQKALCKQLGISEDEFRSSHAA